MRTISYIVPEEYDGAKVYTFLKTYMKISLTLLRSLKRRSEGCGKFRVYMLQSTIYIEPQEEDCDIGEMYERAKRVFGIVGVARAAESFFHTSAESR